MKRNAKILAVVLSSLLAASALPFSAAAAESEVYILGDVNADGKVDITDVTVIQKFIAKLITLSDEREVCADVNSDGTVNITDATLVQKYAAKYELDYAIGEEFTPLSTRTSGRKTQAQSP